MPPKTQELMGLLKIVEDAGRAGELSQDACRNLSRWLKEPQYAAYRDDLAALLTARNFQRRPVLRSLGEGGSNPAPRQARGLELVETASWIATARLAHLAMT